MNTALNAVHSTAREARLVGEALTLEGPALDLWVRAGAARRHAARVEAAEAAAHAWTAEWVRSEPRAGDPLTQGPLAHVVCAILDDMGVGGHMGTGSGGSTLRHPAFAACGSGRKQATDGGAWTAAIGAVVARSLTEEGIRIGLARGAGGIGVCAALVRHDQTGPLQVVAIGDPWQSPAGPWVAALARRCIVDLARGLAGWSHQELELAGEVVVAQAEADAEVNADRAARLDAQSAAINAGLAGYVGAVEHETVIAPTGGTAVYSGGDRW